MTASTWRSAFRATTKSLKWSVGTSQSHGWITLQVRLFKLFVCSNCSAFLLVVCLTVSQFIFSILFVWLFVFLLVCSFVQLSGCVTISFFVYLQIMFVFLYLFRCLLLSFSIYLLVCNMFCFSLYLCFLWLRGNMYFLFVILLFSLLTVCLFL